MDLHHLVTHQQLGTHAEERTRTAKLCKDSKAPRLTLTSSLLSVPDLRNRWGCPRATNCCRGRMGSWETGNEVVAICLKLKDIFFLIFIGV